MDIYALDGRELARHSVLTGHRQQSIIAGHYQTLRVNVPVKQRPGAIQAGTRLLPDAPPVEKRALRHYEAWAEVTAA